jgi:hypothetical protein
VASSRPVKPADVFLNFAFDQRREYLYLSLIASVVGLGMNPRSVLEGPVDDSRLQRLQKLIASCQFSIHDLSAVEAEESRTVCHALICRLSSVSLFLSVSKIAPPMHSAFWKA